MQYPVTKKTTIECECGTHLLMVQSEIDYLYNNKHIQTFDLAMFTYGNFNYKDKFWKRFVTAWKYLKSGEMFADQLVLSPDEAKKLATFINDNIIENENIPR